MSEATPGPASLLGGRISAPLSANDIRRAINTFVGLDSTVNVRYDEDGRTVFRVAVDENGEEFGEIVIGPDIYPGRSVTDPNSALSLDAAAAHELTHYYRWRDKTHLPGDWKEHLDEALTSLSAILRYDRQLQPTDIKQLVSDAIQRITLYLNACEPGTAHRRRETLAAGGRQRWPFMCAEVPTPRKNQGRGALQSERSRSSRVGPVAPANSDERRQYAPDFSARH